MEKALLPILEVRESVDNYLERVYLKENQKVFYTKEFLEQLLFDTFTENGHTFKRLGFISENLSKLDLRGVSFDNVSFNGEDYPYLDDGEQVNLSNTNAVIDFSKSYEYRTKGQVVITSFDLHGTDLSNNNWHDLTQTCFGFIKNSNLSNTSTKLTDEGRKVYLKINNSNLSGNNLSDISISYDKQISTSPEIAFISCTLSKTGINLDYRGEDKDTIRRIVTSPKYKGCQINGRPIRTDEELTEIRETAKKKIMTNPALK